MNLKPNFFDKKGGSVRVAHDESGALQEITNSLHQLLLSHSSIQPYVVVCIGTDRSTGDSLGPLVGTKLSEMKLSTLHVYGTLDEPIHAVNLKDKLIEIQNLHPNPYIIAIDACLGRLKSVGHVTVAEGPVMPGAGVKKDLPPVGDIHITGIVNVSGFMEFFVLQNTRLSLVMRMANTIASSLNRLDTLLARRAILPKTEQESSTFLPGE